MALRASSRLQDAPSWRALALAAAVVGTLTHVDERSLAAAALTAIGVRPSPGNVARFLLARWYGIAADAALAQQADHLSVDWLENNVPLIGSTLPPSAICISVHHACHFLAIARLGSLLPQMGFISSINRANGPNTRRAALLLDLLDRTFGERIYAPESAARACLELLGNGGSVLLFCDFAQRASTMPLFGRRVPVARGPQWFAEKTGRPIIPVMVVPRGRGWALWCGDPVPATSDGLELCVRRAAASWLGWPDWQAVSAVA